MGSNFWSSLFSNDQDIVPFTQQEKLTEGKGFYHKNRKYIHHTNLSPLDSALFRLTFSQTVLIISLVGLFCISLIWDWHLTLVIMVGILTILYFFDLLFNLFLIYRSFSKLPEIKVSDQEIEAQEESFWPTYTIFCPLYKEWQVLPQFVTAMSRLSYPKQKLQVMLLLEEDDQETLTHAKKMNLPDYFEIRIVPHSFPKTKPKACNFGLLKAQGEYSVIYDAEDVPDPLQLKKAVLAFQRIDKKVVCIQAKLNFYNPRQNLLTRIFTAEYSLWFDLVLTGLQSINAPIPLGGTSNHFRTQDLHLLDGWDAFNVTEDCDLGMRLVKRGYQTAIIDSTTLEEANSDIKNWFEQRTRWIKGYMQTYLVHMRRPQDFMQSKSPHILTFQLIVGGKILSMFINPLMWTITIIYFVFRSSVGGVIESFYPTPILYMALTSIIFGNFLYLYYYMVGCAKRDYDDLIKYAFLTPLYWLAMSVAAWVAVYRLITAPHYWSKTKHGLHLKNQKDEAQSQLAVGGSLVDSRIANVSV